ncbi:MAG: DUF3089 domain-containing protein [Kiritimatiellae bacterium]|nr:DUF3089 domain-containing protein [Kiritimatiellia bacterium]
MNRMRVSFLAVCLLALAAGVCCWADQLPATAHRVPDYSTDGDWSMRSAVPDKPFDVFFVHPTTYGTTNMGMNASLDDPENRQETDATVRSQVSVFKERCNIYAPRYRQMSINVLGMSDEDGKPYFDVAFQDVFNAFAHYMKYYNNGRPFFLASHSQGSDMLHSVFAEHRDLIPNDQLVAAYLIGWTFTDKDLEAFNLPLAVTPDQLGGLITWNTVGAGGQSPTLRAGARCVNPLTWTDSPGNAPADLDRCAVIELNDGSVTTMPYFTSAQINADGGLQVPTPAIVDLLNMNMGKECYHRYDYAFFYSNLVYNIGRRCDAWVK